MTCSSCRHIYEDNGRLMCDCYEEEVYDDMVCIEDGYKDYMEVNDED